MDSFGYILLAIAFCWFAAGKLRFALREERTPLVVYGALTLLVMLAAVNECQWQALGTIGVGFYTYMKSSMSVRNVQWKGVNGMLEAPANYQRYLETQNARRLLK